MPNLGLSQSSFAQGSGLSKTSRSTARLFFQILGILVVAVTMLGADSSTTRLDKVGHKLVCQCGCGQILMECNHVGCPVSPVMISELRTQLDGGANEKASLDFFINKYGPIALAAPIRGGFDNVAWIAPFAVLILAVVGVALLVRYWIRRHNRLNPAGVPAAPLAPSGESLQNRIRRDTDYDNWSDNQ